MCCCELCQSIFDVLLSPIYSLKIQLQAKTAQANDKSLLMATIV